MTSPVHPSARAPLVATAPMTATRSGKRNAGEAELLDSDPNTFLEGYFASRGISDMISRSPSARTCERRASRARENFKRLRTAAEEHELAQVTGGGDATTVHARKYKRRLINNRKSAAAGRIFHEVLQKELAHELHVMHLNRSALQVQLARVRSELVAVMQEVAALRAQQKQDAQDFAPAQPFDIPHPALAVPVSAAPSTAKDAPQKSGSPVAVSSMAMTINTTAVDMPEIDVSTPRGGVRCADVSNVEAMFMEASYTSERPLSVS